VITGSEYELRGQAVTAVCQWNGTKNPALPELQAALPLVSTRKTAPRNVAIEGPGGWLVRPFRGLKRAPEPDPVLGDCGDGYASQAVASRTVETVDVAGGLL
jgi:hypothetical protein